MLQQSGLVPEPYRARSDVQTAFHKGERLTLGNCGDRSFGTERLQRKKRSESVMKRYISSGVEEPAFQSVDSFLRRSHCATYWG